MSLEEITTSEYLTEQFRTVTWQAIRIEELEYEVGHLRETLRRIIGYVNSVASSVEP